MVKFEKIVVCKSTLVSATRRIPVEKYFVVLYGLYELNNAHPIMHTLFIKMCIQIGNGISGSVNTGLFIYAMLQTTFVITVISLLIQLLFSMHVSSGFSILLIFYYAFHPRIQNYMMLMTKDVISATFLLIFMISLYMMFAKKQSRMLYIILGGQIWERCCSDTTVSI